MAPNWTTDQILALSPDASSTKNGKSLAIAKQWLTLGHQDQVIWGECKGSGASPYQTQIELTQPAFKCSCPSRKFPCKHGLGLFLLWVEQPNAFSQEIPPEWVAKWLVSRLERSEERNKKSASRNPESATVTKTKRAAQREEKVAAGLQELELWMRDLVRQGLAKVQEKDYGFWDAAAARLVDAQARGLANQLREMSGIVYTGSGWTERLLEKLGRIYLLIEGYQRLEQLPPETQADIRTMIGWAQTQEEVLAQDGVRDRWSILGQWNEEVTGEKDLRSRRTWLWGKNSKKAALILEFAFGKQVFALNLPTGTCIDAELAFYESAYPLRSQIKTRYGEPMYLDDLDGYANFEAAMVAYSQALAKNPWIEQFPVLIQNAIALRDQERDRWFLADQLGHQWLISPRFQQGWELLATGGGHPLQIFGEWNGTEFLPLSAIKASQLIRF